MSCKTEHNDKIEGDLTVITLPYLTLNRHFDRFQSGVNTDYEENFSSGTARP